MAAKKIGKVTHYFDHLGVAIIKLSAPLKKGETVEFKNSKGTVATQVIDSMQVDHKDIEAAKVGDEVGVKVTEKVHEDNLVYAG